MREVKELLREIRGGLFELKECDGPVRTILSKIDEIERILNDEYRERTIFINDVKITATEDWLSYDDIIHLSGVILSDKSYYRITYMWCKIKGQLNVDECVELEHGMRIYVDDLPVYIPKSTKENSSEEDDE